MEKHPVTNICRLGTVFIIVALSVSVARANLLLNPGFETVGANPSNAASWTQFGNATLNTTNSTTVTIHTGLYSMSAGFTATNSPPGSGAFQDVAQSGSTTYRLTGYLFNWQNAKLVGPDGYFVAQLAFLDSSSNVLQLTESPHYGSSANLPVNTWVPFQVDATAPGGTAAVRTYIMAVGDSLDFGTVFFDDLNLYQPGAGTTTGAVTSVPAVQVSWPTSTQTNETDYQVQYATTLVFTNQINNVVNVITNSSFETNNLAWTLQAGSSYSTGLVPAHTGTNTLKEVTATTGLVPVTYQAFNGIPTNSVWDLEGYAYNWSGAPIHQAGTRALLKIVWLNSSGLAQQCVPANQDTNLIGSVETGSYPGIVSQTELSGVSPQNVWTFLEARGTAPTNATQIQSFCILVTGASGPTETVFFDDIIAFQPVLGAVAQWNNLGPLWLGTGLTNQVFDAVGANTNRFYRVTTP